MKNFLIRKILFVFLTIILISTTFFTYNNVQAYSIKEDTLKTTSNFLDDLINTEEKIMEYDARTGITREVDMKELRLRVDLKNRQRTYSKLTLEPIAPILIENSSKNDVPLEKMDLVGSMQAISTSKITTFPYRATCRVVADTYDGKIMHASAAIVGSHIALTAAHCIFDKEDNFNFYKNWKVYAGYYIDSSTGKEIYVGTPTGWDKVYYSPKYKDNIEAYENDWAICILQSELGNSTGAYRSYFSFRL